MRLTSLLMLALLAVLAPAVACAQPPRAALDLPDRPRAAPHERDCAPDDLPCLQRVRDSIDSAGHAVVTLVSAPLLVAGAAVGFVGIASVGFSTACFETCSTRSSDFGYGLAIGGLVVAGVSALTLIVGAVSWASADRRRRRLTRTIDSLTVVPSVSLGEVGMALLGRF
jgi:uncharacterized membrane protein YidH (DUF202 family)